MEVIKMDSSDEEIRLEVKGEGHTFCNALQNFLLKDPIIFPATYFFQLNKHEHHWNQRKTRQGNWGKIVAGIAA